MSDNQNPDNDSSPDLDHSLVASLRAIPPAVHEVRDAHIAAALRELAPRKQRRVSPISVAASIILVVAVGATLFARTGKNATPVLAAHSITAYIPTKGITVEDYDQAQGANTCQLGDNQIFGVYLMDTQPMKLAWQADEISVMNGDSCEVVATFKRPQGRAPLPQGKAKLCAVSMAEGATFLADTTAAGYKYQVFATNIELLLHDCATNTIVDRIPHPDPEAPLFP